MTEPRRCLHILAAEMHPERGYVPCLITEGEPGYSPMIGRDSLAVPWYWGTDAEIATRICAQINLKLFGVDEAAAAEIVGSSIFAQIRGDAKQAAFQERHANALGRPNLS